MVIPVSPSTASAAQNGLGFFSSLKVFAKILGVVFVAFLLFGNAAIKGIQQQSFGIFAIEVIKNVALVSDNIDKSSVAIIDGENLTKLEMTKNLYNLLDALMLLFAWLFIFAYGFAHTHWSNPSQWFQNYSFSLLVYFVLQIFANLIAAGLTNSLNTMDAVLSCFALPVTSFIHLGQAINVIIIKLTGGLQNG